ncbi:MAG: hypothetical protein KJ049_10810 [Gammaproteobacteria bacterium]|jgi:hypothetical protein|nr:hypothetical protein [Gammaproteobacteria bacterium]
MRDLQQDHQTDDRDCLLNVGVAIAADRPNILVAELGYRRSQIRTPKFDTKVRRDANDR